MMRSFSFFVVVVAVAGVLAQGMGSAGQVS